jgi:hypothetical protein
MAGARHAKDLPGVYGGWDLVMEKSERETMEEHHDEQRRGCGRRLPSGLEDGAEQGEEA